ncbi:MAG: hypothetical protein HC874_24930 [Richelia sp. SL_2_1]|nr:hypothetical protein [Richelia sp. SM1_7_0]NJO30420.1 hypothetical protein [Richelia sp. SL_2_1]
MSNRFWMHYQGFDIAIEYNGLVDWGYEITGVPCRRSNWGYLEPCHAFEAAKAEIDIICIHR